MTNQKDGTRRAQRLSCVLGGVGLLLLATGLGILIAAVPAMSAPDALVAPGCKQARHTLYARCGHELLTRRDVPPQLVGMTRERAGEALSTLEGGWQLTAFSPQKIETSRTLDLFCPAHWVLMMDENGETAVYRNTGGLAMERLSASPVPAQDAQARALLRQGVAFDSLEALEDAAEALRAAGR